MENLIIIGSGPAGMTAAIYTARADLNPLVAAGVQWGGLLMWTTHIENFPGFPEGIMGPNLMADMKKQAEKFGARFVIENITDVDLSGQIKRIKIGDEWHESKAVIISSGTKPRTLRLEREKSLIGRGLSVCATCDAAFYRDKQVIVVGGGDSAMEEANFLTKFVAKVYLIIREDKPMASPIMFTRAKQNPKIEIWFNHEVVEYVGQDKLEGVRVINNNSNAILDLPIDGLFFAIGQEPTTAIYKGQLATDEAGYLIKNPDNSMSNLDGVFIAGDISDRIYRQAIVAAGEGAKAALDCIRWLERQE
ncbi:MAG TPA: thioredoxin-disulfide reductase [bacterium]|nr:thioredoxin-disulfide reductase [bacterium]